MLTNDEVDTWLAALRSGEYIQGRGAMCRETLRGVYWCPLGVLVNEIWDGDWVQSENGVLWGIEARGRRSYTQPPASVIKVPSNLMAAIVQRNDHSGWSFRVIADWIDGYRDVLTKGARGGKG